MNFLYSKPFKDKSPEEKTQLSLWSHLSLSSSLLAPSQFLPWHPRKLILFFCPLAIDSSRGKLAIPFQNQLANSLYSSGPNYADIISPCPGGLQDENDNGSCASKRGMNKFMFRNVMNEARAAVAEPEVVQVDAWVHGCSAKVGAIWFQLVCGYYLWGELLYSAYFGLYYFYLLR